MRIVTCTHLKLSCSAAGTVSVTAGSSSGVVGGLMTGEQYQFSVSVTVSGSGRSYTGPLSDPITVRAPPNDGGKCLPNLHSYNMHFTLFTKDQ